MSRRVSIIALSLLFLVLNARVLFSHDEIGSTPKLISDREFARELFGQSGVQAPVYLGCREMAGAKPELPLFCIYQNIQTEVSKVLETNYETQKLFETAVATNWWHAVDQTSVFSQFSPDIDWEWAWAYQGNHRSIYCVKGVPLIEIGNILDFAECLILINSDLANENGRAIRLVFKDTGELQLYADNERRDLVRLLNFVSFFALETWN